eukprot:Nitzschia sp. Nitz4//scaffold31_size150131//46141//47715//NITZ4_002820-RA/size150131-processed-gene-0.192-mRNA-1//1//CDS//3329547635//1640//frame0
MTNLTPYVTSGNSRPTSHQTSTPSYSGVYVPGSNGAGSNPPTRTTQHSVYQPSTSTNVYQPASTTTPSSTGVYQPATSTTNAYQPASTNVYAPATYTSTSTTSGGVYAPASSSASATAYQPAAAPAPTPTPAPSQPLPDFSQALDRPPPQPQAPTATLPTAAATAPAAYSYGNTYNATKAPQTYQPQELPPPTNPSYAPSAVATPVTNTGGAGGFSVTSLNSSNYSGGPTGGLVTEGNPVKCDKVHYEIKGHECQLVEIQLEPQKTVIAEAGAMMFLDEGIDFETKFGDGSTPKEGFFKQLLKAGGRLLMGESLFVTHFKNQGQSPARVAFAAPYPGTILPMNLQDLPGGKIICQKDAFLCAALGTKLSIHFNKKIGSGLFGGEGFILQRLEGDGMAFVHAGGMVIRRELRNEKLRLDTGCVVAFTDGIDFDIQLAPGLKSMFFGGEGLFLATLKGTGTVWIQSLPFSRFADRVIQYAPSAGGRRQGEGSALTGGFGDIINGDGFGFHL